jgi:hypothetical protein
MPCAASPNPQEIQVGVCNYSPVTPAVLSRAEEQAARIFQGAGIDVRWTDCSDAGDVSVRVLAGSVHKGFGETVFGFAVQPLLASVYYDSTERLARRDDANYEVETVLACAIAHEIGHLLLGPGRHSPSGIMSAVWERGQIQQALTGRLMFTVQQSAAMRANIEQQQRSRNYEIAAK